MPFAFDRVMILRSVPEVFGKDVRSEIGAPQDYTKNKQKASFPDSYDLRVPGAERPAAAETMEVEVSAAAGHANSPRDGKRIATATVGESIVNATRIPPRPTSA